MMIMEVVMVEKIKTTKEIKMISGKILATTTMMETIKMIPLMMIKMIMKATKTIKTTVMIKMMPTMTKKMMETTKTMKMIKKMLVMMMVKTTKTIR